MLSPIYHEARLGEAVQKLHPNLRVAFAVACAERLLSAAASFVQGSQNDDLLKSKDIAGRLWLDLEGGKMSASEVEQAIEVCIAMIERIEGGSSNWQESAVGDAVAALCYALRCHQTGDTKEAVWAARRPYESLDAYVIDQEGIDTNKPNGEQRVLSHPLIQAEVARQQRDLDDLLTAQDLYAVERRLRERA